MRLLLNSKGFNTKRGTKIIYEMIKDDKLAEKTIFLVSYTPYEVDEIMRQSCIDIGFKKENIYMSVDGVPDILADYCFVTEGNTFEILQYMRFNGFDSYIKKVAREKPEAVYIGSSAGAAIAGSDIRLAEDFDSNFVRLNDYTGLCLFDGAIIPHYTPEQLKRYIENTPEYLIEKYKIMYSVANDEIMVIDGEKVQTYKIDD